jgi:hypothetical protein
MGNDISTRTLGEPRLELVGLAGEGEPSIDPVEQFSDPLPLVDEPAPEAAPLAAYQNVSFVEVLGTPLDVTTAVRLYEDLGDALAKAALDA